MSNHILDWEQTLKLCNNNKGLANELISMLKTDLPAQKRILIDAYERHDTRTLRDIVHQIIGSCSYISLPQLKEAANNMHNDIHTSNKDLTPAKKELIQAIDNAILFKK